MLTSKLPGWLSAEIGRAWAASDGRNQAMAAARASKAI
jgi:hypothetical protein